MRFTPGNAQHIGARQYQQDFFGSTDPADQAFTAHGGFVAIVADGMGGLEHGDQASRTAVRVFLESYRAKEASEPIPAALERSLRDANAAVVNLARSVGTPDGVGTTLIAIALKNSSLYWISVGDSGIFLCRDGSMLQLNRAHVFANLLEQAVARGALSREEADNHPERESLTSFVGSEVLEEIDRNTQPFSLKPGDMILLCTDGLFKTLSGGEILAAVSGGPQEISEALVRQTLEKQREYQDNVTVVAIAVEEGDAAPAPGSASPATIRLPSPPAAAPPAAPAAAPPPAVVAQPEISPPPVLPPAAPMPSAGPPPIAGEKHPTARSRARRLWPAAALIAALMGGGLWWYFSRHTTTAGAGEPTHHEQPSGRSPELKRPPAAPHAPLIPQPGEPNPAKGPAGGGVKR